jgi:IPT/TIG domain
MGMVRYPLPITPAMLQLANANMDKPRYAGAGVAGDWAAGAVGNDANVATATVALANAASAVPTAAYAPTTQTGKAQLMTPALGYPAAGVPIVDDIGIDYGIYAGQTDRTGTITPAAPYPDANSPPSVTAVSPSTGLAAGGTNVTISGNGFTGATAVTFGGTAATAVVVVSASTITATSPAKAAGTYDVRVTTPKGVSPVVGAADNFIYT